VRAATRLGAPDEKSDLGDPRLMALHALNVLIADWKEVSFRDSRQEQPLLQYQSPEAEVKQLEQYKRSITEAGREKPAIGILNALYASQAPSPEFLERDGVGKRTRERPWRIVRSSTGTENILRALNLCERRDVARALWHARNSCRVRDVDARSFCSCARGRFRPGVSMRDGLRSTRARGFGWSNAAAPAASRDDDIRRLLEFASASGYASAHGLGQL